MTVRQATLVLPSVISFLIPKLKAMGLNLEGAHYFRFFTLLMFGASIIYVFVSRFYHEKTYLQSQVTEDELATEPRTQIPAAAVVPHQRWQ